MSVFFGIILLIAAAAYGWFFAWKRPLERQHRQGNRVMYVSRTWNLLDWLFVSIVALIGFYLVWPHHHHVRYWPWWLAVALVVLALACFIAALRWGIALWFAVIALILAIVMFFVGAFQWLGVTPSSNDTGVQPSASASSSQSASSSSSTVSDAVLAKLLTVKTVSSDCSTLVPTTDGVVKYDIGSLKAVPPRKWSNAISTPNTGKTLAQQLRQENVAIKRDPVLGTAVANMYATLTVGSTKVSSLNPWLVPYETMAQANTRAAGFVPLRDVAHPTKAQLTKAKTANVNYESLADKLCTLNGRLAKLGDKSLQSSMNWHLKGDGVVAGSLPKVELNARQESLPALVLAVTAKGACAPVKVIGFNLGDKRPEVFPTPSCSKSTSTPTSTSHPSKTPVVHPSKTPTTSPTPSATPTRCVCVTKSQVSQSPKAAPSQAKDVPSKAPSAQPTKSPDASAPATKGGNNGGSSSQPAATAPPSPVSSNTNGGDPGGL